MVPVYGSQTANKTLAVALQMASESQGRVRIVHVIAGLAYAGGTVAATSGVEVESELFDTFDGRLADVVSDAAKDWQADLIVVGTHGRRGIGRILMGSGAEQILRQASAPVLVIRAQGPAST